MLHTYIYDILWLGQRRAELNKKGEEKERKGGDMLDVFKVSGIYNVLIQTIGSVPTI